MDLKDLFAAHVAAALADRIEQADLIARRAYDLADALLRERARRLPIHDDAEDDEQVWEWGEDVVPDEEFFRPSAGLLDEPAPWSDREGMELDPSWLEHDQKPEWEAEPKMWSTPDAPFSERPGLARTTPTPAEDEKKRRPA